MKADGLAGLLPAEVRANLPDRAVPKAREHQTDRLAQRQTRISDATSRLLQSDHLLTDGADFMHDERVVLEAR